MGRGLRLITGRNGFGWSGRLSIYDWGRRNEPEDYYLLAPAKTRLDKEAGIFQGRESAVCYVLALLKIQESGPVSQYAIAIFLLLFGLAVAAAGIGHLRTWRHVATGQDWVLAGACILFGVMTAAVGGFALGQLLGAG